MLGTDWTDWMGWTDWIGWTDWMGWINWTDWISFELQKYKKRGLRVKPAMTVGIRI